MSLIFSTCFVLVCQPFLGTSYLREMTGLKSLWIDGWGNSIRNQCSIMYVRKRINTTYYRYKTEIFLHFQTTIPSVPKLRLLGSRRLYIPRRRTNAWLHEQRWLAQPRWLLTNYYIYAISIPESQLNWLAWLSSTHKADFRCVWRGLTCRGFGKACSIIRP